VNGARIVWSATTTHANAPGTIAEVGDLPCMTNEGKSSRSSYIGLLQSAIGHWLQETYDLWAPIPAKHTELLKLLDQSPGETVGKYKFQVGQAVQFSHTDRLYAVTAVLPERDGEVEYCINNEGEPYQRLAKESELSPAI
jgi:hypothetical protein